MGYIAAFPQQRLKLQRMSRLPSPSRAYRGERGVGRLKCHPPSTGTLRRHSRSPAVQRLNYLLDGGITLRPSLYWWRAGRLVRVTETMKRPTHQVVLHVFRLHAE